MQSSAIASRLARLAHSFPPLRALHIHRSAMAAASSSSSSSSNSSGPCLSESQLHTAVHVHARGPSRSYPTRQSVPDARVAWSTPFPEYAPPEFTSDNVIKNSKDPTDPRLIPNLSARASCETPELQLCPEGRPLNPHGRTGLRGRGRLYKWGPNHAADPLVSRVSTASTSTSSPDLEPVLEIVVIRRGDTGAWALPGGMVDPGEAPRHTARREFGEEAMAHTDPAMRQHCERILDRVFGEGDGATAAAEIQRVYAGYIDDPRNTDNAWIESAVLHSHLDTPLAAELSSLLRAGDDANEVKWLRATADEADMQNLYASHRPIVQLAVHKWKEAQKGKKSKE